MIIGAEHRQEPGYTHHDVQDLPGIDIKCDFWELPNYVEPSTCEEIKTTHFLEHIPMGQTHAAFLLIHSLLSVGGKLYIEVPNFKWHAEQILRNPRNRKVVEYAYGGQRNEWDYHYNGFTADILTEDLLEAGFKLLEMHDNSSLECWSERT